MYDAAIDHVIASGDVPATVNIFQRYMALPDQRFRPNFRARAMTIPDDMAVENAVLIMLKSLGLYSTATFGNVRVLGARFAERLHKDSPHVDRLFVHCFDSENALMAGDTVSALDHLDKAIVLAQHVTPNVAAVPHLLLAETAALAGDLPTAIAAAENGIALNQQSAEIITTENLVRLLGQLRYLNGEQLRAFPELRTYAERFLDFNGNPLPTVSLIRIAEGMIQYEQNQIQTALLTFEQNLALASQITAIQSTGYAIVIYAKLLFAKGESERAFAVLGELHTKTQAFGGFQYRGLVEASLAELYLRQGDVEAARQQLQEVGFSTAQPPDSHISDVQTAWLSVQLAQGHAAIALQHVTMLLNQLSSSGGVHFFRYTMIAALAKQQLGQHVNAEETMRSAVQAAAAGNYIRSFLDFGHAIAPLLLQAQSSEPVFVTTLLEQLEREQVDKGEIRPKITLYAPRFDLRLFGTFELRINGASVPTLYSNRARALLARLAIEPDLPHSRAMLADLLFGDFDQQRARKNLRNTLSKLKHNLAPIADSILHSTRQALQLHLPQPAHTVDTVQFDLLMSECRNHNHDAIVFCSDCIQRLFAAVELYRGELLVDLSLPECPAFDEWRLLEQEKRHQQVLSALDTLIAHYADSNHTEHVLHLASRQLALEPWHETAHMHLIRSLAQTRGFTSARLQYETYARILHDEFGIDPHPKVRSLLLQTSTTPAAPSFLTA